MGDGFGKAVSHFNWRHYDWKSNGILLEILYRPGIPAAKQGFDVSCFTHVANRMRYDAPHQVGDQMMRKDFSEDALSGLSSDSQTRSSGRTERTPYPTAESQILMENEMSSQTLVRTNTSRASFVRSVLVIVADRINMGLSAFARRFMDALGESRQRQAEQVMRRYRDLIDDSRD